MAQRRFHVHTISGLALVRRVVAELRVTCVNDGYEGTTRVRITEGRERRKRRRRMDGMMRNRDTGTEGRRGTAGHPGDLPGHRIPGILMGPP